jgi:transcription antitermination factor NusG
MVTIAQYMPALAWYAVYTRPRSEKKLAEGLQKIGIEHYLPLLRRRKKWSDRYKWVEEPVFSSYLFVRVHDRAEMLRVLQLPQAAYFVSTEGAPTVIADSDLDLLRLAVENYADSLVIKNSAELAIGERVLVASGPFAGEEAIVEEKRGKAFVVVSFPALSRSVQVELSLEQLTRI